MAFAGTDMQRDRGIEDSPDLLQRDLLAVGEHRNDPSLVAAYCDGQLDLYRWLVDRGVVFEDVELSSGQSAPRSHRTDPVALVATLQAAALAGGASWEPGVRATDLLLDDSTVVGVRTSDGRRIGGRVVLATGGFSRNEELLGRYAPRQARARRVGGAGSTGDGLIMATDVGAGTRDFEFIKGTFGTHPSTGTDKHEISLAYYLGAVIVDRHGERFVDESISYKDIGDACLGLDDPLAFQIFDRTVFDAAPAGVPLFDQRSLLDRGLLLSAPSLDELAEQIGVPAAALDRTIGAYNAAIGNGDDAFGRTHLVEGTGELVALAEPPFYAFPSTTALIATYCGITIDAGARVRDSDGRPIPGLWAAGEITGGFHGTSYMTGSSLGKAASFGRTAGRGAAQDRYDMTRDKVGEQ
jgi:fumarate reductase flavoprotein subunit